MRRTLSTAPLSLVLVPFVASATTLRVDCDGGGDYSSIGEAAAVACPGDTILVAPSTYAGPSNRGVELPHGGLSLLSEGAPAPRSSTAGPPEGRS